MINIETCILIFWVPIGYFQVSDTTLLGIVLAPNFMYVYS